MDVSGLRLGWSRAEWERVRPDRSSNGWPFLAKRLGPALTAAALSLGAPFWFDVLNKAISVRGAGRAPNERPESPQGAPRRAPEAAPG